jgi:hypothetical protein
VAPLEIWGACDALGARRGTVQNDRPLGQVCVCVPFGLDPTSEARVSIECWLPARGTYHEPVQLWIDCTLARLHSPTVRLVARSSGRWQGAESDGPGRGRGRGKGRGRGYAGRCVVLCGVFWCCVVFSGVVWCLISEERVETRDSRLETAGIPGLELGGSSIAMGWHWKAFRGIEEVGVLPWGGISSGGSSGRGLAASEAQKAQQLRTRGGTSDTFALQLCSGTLLVLTAERVFSFFFPGFLVCRPGTLLLARPYFWEPRRLSFASPRFTLLHFPPLPSHSHSPSHSPLPLPLPFAPNFQSCRVGLPWGFSDFCERHATIAFELSSLPSPPFYIKMSRGGENIERGSRG